MAGSRCHKTLNNDLLADIHVLASRKPLREPPLMLSKLLLDVPLHACQLAGRCSSKLARRSACRKSVQVRASWLLTRLPPPSRQLLRAKIAEIISVRFQPGMAGKRCAPIRFEMLCCLSLFCSWNDIFRLYMWSTECTLSFQSRAYCEHLHHDLYNASYAADGCLSLGSLLPLPSEEFRL